MKIDCLYREVLRFEGLDLGFANRVGNALRQVLLSEILGVAVTRVAISGVFHEFAPIPGVREDFAVVIAAFKNLAVKYIPEFGVKKVTLQRKEPGPVFARDFDWPQDVDLMNPDLLICTLDQGGADLYVEITLEAGRNVVLANNVDKSDVPYGTIAIDAIFNPVLSVNYSVENGRDVNGDLKETLVLDIETNGCISASEAVDFSVSLLQKQFKSLDSASGIVPETKKEEDKKSNLWANLNLSIGVLSLSKRARSVLESLGLYRLGDVVTVDKAVLLSQQNFGLCSLTSIENALKSYNLSLGMKIDGWVPSDEAPTDDNGFLFEKV